MTHDVRQWLAEIKTLQQQLAEAHQERDQAYAGAVNWRKLYETEAQQRRTEAHLAQQTIDALKTEVQRLQTPLPIERQDPTKLSQLQQDVELHTIEELRTHLIQLNVERDRLLQSLKLEQIEHEKTRKALTGALGDTVDLLAKERARHQGLEYSQPAPSVRGDTTHTAKIPSLERPMLDQAQSPA